MVHISAGMIIDFWYFGRNIPLSNGSCRNQTGTPTCLMIGVTILASTKEMQIVLPSQCTVVETLWRARASMYLQITLVFFTSLYMNIISSSVESEAIARWICNFCQKATPRIVWKIPETDHLLFRTIEWYATWWYSKQFWVV